MSEVQHTRDATNGIDHLLEPSLGDRGGGASIFSVRAGFFVAFFGGGFAAVIFGVLNSRRLNRLAQDWWIYVLGAIVFGAAAVCTGHQLGGVPLDSLATAEGRDRARVLRMASRALALGYFGLIFLRHRRFHKAMELSTEDPPSPWVPGIAAAAAGAAITFPLAMLGAWIAQ